ncbi:hypothetical protein B7494_g7553 [Chlorociboria aeruginascens]|nr:hypothetical protein B7494_g7553 [Chlorociboria aeruginascens]
MHGQGLIVGSKTKHRTRASKPKVKTGCKTCRIRRVKCGEERPGCIRCAKFGLECDGYGTRTTATGKNGQNPAPFVPIAPRFPSLSLYAPSVALKLEQAERRYFQDFVENTSLDLQGRGFLSHDQNVFTDSFFWNGIALRESHRAPCIRHAIVAIGALARSLQIRHRRPPPEIDALSQLDHHHEFALQQYDKAIRHLREYARLSDGKTGTAITLIACLVLASFDSIHGDRKCAAQHIKFGRKVLSDWKARQQLPEISFNDPIDNRLARMFMRLDLQASSFMGVEAQCLYETLESGRLEEDVPEVFTSTHEVRRLGHLILFKAYNFFLQTFHYRFLPPDKIPTDVLEEKQYFITKVLEWTSAVKPLMNSLATETNQSAHPLNTLKSVRLYPSILLLRLAMSLNATEVECDLYEEHFVYMLDTARAVIHYEKDILSGTYLSPLPRSRSSETNNNQDISSFCFEVRIIPALYLVATKCRVHSYRAEAISLLLSSHRREGMWDSYLAGKVGEWIMGIEEETIPSLPSPTSATPLPLTRKTLNPKSFNTVGENNGRKGKRPTARKGINGIATPEESSPSDTADDFIPEEKRCGREVMELNLQGRTADVRVRLGSGEWRAKRFYW